MLGIPSSNVHGELYQADPIELNNSPFPVPYSTYWQYIAGGGSQSYINLYGYATHTFRIFFSSQFPVTDFSIGLEVIPPTGVTLSGRGLVPLFEHWSNTGIPSYQNMMIFSVGINGTTASGLLFENVAVMVKNLDPANNPVITSLSIISYAP